MTPDALAALHGQAFPDGGAWRAGDFASLLESPGCLLLGDAKGFLLGRMVADEAEILTLAIAPPYRRRGHASRLLQRFEAACARAGIGAIFLEVAADNAPARALYAAVGYAGAGRRPAYYARPGGPRIDALLLRRTLPGLAGGWAAPSPGAQGAPPENG